MKTAKELIHKWHEVVKGDEPKLLDKLLAENAVFSSPVVFKPLEGKAITMMYLQAAGDSFNMEKFKYTKEIHDGLHSVLEFVKSASFLVLELKHISMISQSMVLT